MGKTYVFDLDGTLCTNTEGEYDAAVPLPWAVARVNALRRAGHRIVIFTARGTTTGIDWRPTAERQLAEWGVEYDELLLGKPYGDVYVDDKALHADAWRYGHAQELSGPGHAPPRSTAVIEVTRTFGGRTYAVEDHARRLLGAAAAGRLGPLPPIGEIVEAVETSTSQRRELLEPGDDVVAVLSLAGPAHAAFLDTTDAAAEPELLVTCRLLSQPVAALGPLLEQDGLIAATDGRPGAWPVERGADGALRDRLGGDVVRVRDGRLELLGEPGVAGRMALRLAAEAAQVGAAEEIVVLGMPFCVLPVVRLDGEPVGDGCVGAMARALEAGWARLTGVDVAAQRRALLGRTA